MGFTLGTAVSVNSDSGARDHRLTSCDMWTRFALACVGPLFSDQPMCPMLQADSQPLNDRGRPLILLMYQFFLN